MRVEDHIEKREQEYRAHLTDYSKPIAIKNAARAALSTVREDVLESGEDEWRHDWIVRYLERQRALYRAPTPEDVPERHLDGEDEEAIELRERTLCTCSSRQCKLKQGDLPTTVRTADTLGAGIQQFRREHPGDPLVLTDAMEAWRERMAHVADVLELVTTSLGHQEHLLGDELRESTESLLDDTSAIPEPGTDTEEVAP